MRSKRNRSRLDALLLLLILLFTAILPAANKTGRQAPVSMEAKIQAVLNDPTLKNARVGIDVVALDNGERIYSLLRDEPFVVASNMKLATTAAALDLLGPDYVFGTSVYRAGPIDPATGVLDGGLVIRGAGDPNISGRVLDDDVGKLMNAVLDAWAKAITDLGVKEVRGNIVADDTLFDRVYICPTWPKNQLDHWYCAEVCALSFNDNCLDVSITPANRVGASAAVTCLPETAYVTLTKNCMTVADRRQHAIILARKPGTNEIRIGGSCWIGSPPLKENITIHNPALFFATIFKECLERAGVKVTGEARLTDEPLKEIEVPANEVAASESPLDYVVQFTNKRSQNLCAEQLFKTLGAVKTGAGTFEGGAAAVREFLGRLQVGQDRCVVADGSGLSKANRLTPAVMTSLLGHMYEHKYREAFVNSLAVPGEEGSLKKRFMDESYRSCVRAKTGYVAGASCLSGYATTRGGRPLAFAIFINKYAVSNLTMHAMQDKIVKALVDM